MRAHRTPRGRTTTPASLPAPGPIVPAASVVISWSASAAAAMLIVQLAAVIDARSAGRAPAVIDLIAILVAAVVAGILAAAGIAVAASASARTERSLRAGIIERAGSRSTRTHAASWDAAIDAAPRAAQYRAGFVGPILAAMTSPFVVLAVMALAVDPLTAGLLAALVLVVPFLVGGFQRMVSPIGAQSRRTQAALTASFLAAIGALESLTYLGAARRVGERLARDGEAHRRSLMRVLAANQVLIFVVDIGFSLAVVVMSAVLGAHRVSQGVISAGEGVVIVLLAVLVVAPVDVMGQFFYIGIGGRAAQRRLQELFDEQPLPTPARASGDGCIVVADVTLGWGDEDPVVRGLSFAVEPGEIVALVGPSGAGKSTIVAALLGHLEARSGVVRIESDRVSIVDQDPYLFHGSIADNLRLANPRATETELWAALDAASLAVDVRRLPDALDTDVGERGSRLSGGQVQRLAIARAWLHDAPVLILDEPTSRVDLATEAVIVGALRRLARGRTVLVVSHRPDTVLAADRVVDLAEVRA